ncbi:MAG: hypothetical protein ACSLFR_03855 [Solirubrobacteraceae bacterium]
MRDEPLSDEDREGALGWLLLKLVAAAFLLLTVGLILDGVGAPGGALAGVVGLLVVFVLIWATPVIDWVSGQSRWY